MYPEPQGNKKITTIVILLVGLTILGSLSFIAYRIYQSNNEAYNDYFGKNELKEYELKEYKVKDKTLTKDEWKAKKTDLSSKMSSMIASKKGLLGATSGVMTREEREEWYDMTSQEGCWNIDSEVDVVDWDLIDLINNKFTNNTCDLSVVLKNTKSNIANVE